MQAEAGHIKVEVEAEMEPQAEADKFQAVVEQIHQNVCMEIEPKPIREENQQEENGNRARPAVKKWNPRKEELHSRPRKKRLQSRILKLRKQEITTNRSTPEKKIEATEVGYIGSGRRK
ncbi:uncharacterized protein LOC120358828 isoform X2 [Solenopsis invicta]|uniref:uncharacterized protein LOC120358828 isoform X2 n=1 Tax=Solenopsis invicta TaxID=13686 RepID=UPI00193D316F|nr:uncharacterized protein LOC120358828 isoform X2 [Solenopsis invicta]